ncbi:MAG: DegT/DnrJ/EryC1/StrS family aminotransferase [Holophagales bacterium]|nr:DegT/DnrJ/EryC1/StrS family aminotransferase [Holophagales bacterium]
MGHDRAEDGAVRGGAEGLQRRSPLPRPPERDDRPRDDARGARHRARRRGDHDRAHVRLHGLQRRPPGSRPDPRRRRARHDEPRRRTDRGEDHAPDEGDRPGPLRRAPLPDGTDLGDRRPPRPRGDRGRRPHDGARYAGRRIGSDPRSVFRLQLPPEQEHDDPRGGAIAFHDERHAAYFRLQRFHGIARGEGTPFPDGSPLYDVPMPGRKSNFMDVQAAVGLHQLKRLDGFAARRGTLARLYLSLLADVPEVELPADGDAVREHCWNLFVLRNRPERTGLSRDELMSALKAENVGTGVHWQGLFGFSFYRDYFAKHPEGLPKDGLPHATRATDNLMSLPLWPGMTEDDVLDVVAALERVLARRR